MSSSRLAAEKERMAHDIDALRSKLTARMLKTMVVDRSKTRDRLDYFESRLREIKVLWEKEKYGETAALLDILVAGRAWSRCWRAVRGEDLAAYAIDKAAAHADMETLIHDLPALAQRLEQINF
jgi:hypothetical protein